MTENDLNERVDDLDIGETTPDTVEDDLHLWNLTMIDDWSDYDRTPENMHVKAAEVVGDPGDQKLRLTLGADVKKRELPEDVEEPLWKRDPVVQETDSATTESSWIRRNVGSILTAGSITLLSVYLTQQFFELSNVSMNGEPVTAPSATALLAVAGGVVLFAAFLVWAAQVMPRPGGRY